MIRKRGKKEKKIHKIKTENKKRRNSKAKQRNATNENENNSKWTKKVNRNEWRRIKNWTQQKQLIEHTATAENKAKKKRKNDVDVVEKTTTSDTTNVCTRRSLETKTRNTRARVHSFFSFNRNRHSQPTATRKKALTREIENYTMCLSYVVFVGCFAIFCLFDERTKQCIHSNNRILTRWVYTKKNIN